jgi:hypothetical protein
MGQDGLLDRNHNVGLRVVACDRLVGPMRFIALVWIACLAVYVEILARSRPPPKMTMPWPTIILCAGVAASFLWAAWLGRVATTTLKTVFSQFW